MDWIKTVKQAPPPGSTILGCWPYGGGCLSIYDVALVSSEADEHGNLTYTDTRGALIDAPPHYWVALDEAADFET